MTTDMLCGCEETTGTTAVLPVKGLSLCVGLDGVLGELPSGGEGPDFSLEEQWTGRRWIDGKKIWQKTINTGALTNGVTKEVAHGIVDIDYILSVRGFGKRLDAGKYYYINLPHIGSPSLMVGMHVHDKVIRLIPNGNFSGYTESFMTVMYTRTGG